MRLSKKREEEMAFINSGRQRHRSRKEDIVHWIMKRQRTKASEEEEEEEEDAEENFLLSWDDVDSPP